MRITSEGELLKTRSIQKNQELDKAAIMDFINGLLTHHEQSFKAVNWCNAWAFQRWISILTAYNKLNKKLG
jgi:hypothetical protein